MFNDKSRFGFVPLESAACLKPENLTEDIWAGDSKTPKLIFEWPPEEEEDQGEESEPKEKSKSSIVAIRVGVAIGVVAIGEIMLIQMKMFKITSQFN